MSPQQSNGATPRFRDFTPVPEYFQSQNKAPDNNSIFSNYKVSIPTKVKSFFSWIKSSVTPSELKSRAISICKSIKEPVCEAANGALIGLMAGTGIMYMGALFGIITAATIPVFACCLVGPVVITAFAFVAFMPDRDEAIV